jgi:ubiquinone/menaquinone biosynthesis C-methylase UbiE
MNEDKMKDHLEKWLEGKGERVLRKIGIREGQKVLDFGCGSGAYTIPVAIVVGEEGIVYALDKDERALDKLMQRAEGEGLRNIRRMDTSGEVEIRLDDESVDVVLLYDIFWYFPLSDPRLTKLLAEVYRVSRRQASISVIPKHIDSEQFKDKMEGAGFQLNKKNAETIIHDGALERGLILNFVKKEQSHGYGHGSG